jgi:hypothetical protein
VNDRPMRLRGAGRCPAARNYSPSGARALRTVTAVPLNATVTSLFAASPKCPEGDAGGAWHAWHRGDRHAREVRQNDGALVLSTTPASHTDSVICSMHPNMHLMRR